jgi:hypothetical protein
MMGKARVIGGGEEEVGKKVKIYCVHNVSVRARLGDQWSTVVEQGAGERRVKIPRKRENQPN